MQETKSSEQPDLATLTDRVRPSLQKLEAHRQAMRKSTLVRSGVFIGILVVAGIIAAVAAGHSAPVFMALFAAAILVIIYISKRQTKWADHAGSVLIPDIAGSHAEDIRYQPTADRALVKPFDALELLGQWNRVTVKHLVHGAYRGRRFEWALANLRHESSGSGKRNSSVTQIFYGLMFRVQTRTRFEPGLSIRPNFGWFSKTFGKRAIPTGNEAFDAVFLVSVDDDSQLDSTQLNRMLTPEWQQALLNLHEDAGTLPYEQTRLRAGMKYDSFYLALTMEEEGRKLGRIRTSKMRTFPDVGHLMAKKSSLDSKLERIIEDVGTFRRIIDRLPDGGPVADNGS